MDALNIDRVRHFAYSLAGVRVVCPLRRDFNSSHTFIKAFSEWRRKREKSVQDIIDEDIVVNP